MYIIRTPDGQRWKVREAVSLKAACSEIAHARVTGSIGGKTTLQRVDEEIKIISDVILINSDGTERQPYSQGY